MAAIGSSASLDRSPRKNWVENAGSLPRAVREVARALHERRGMPLSRAIAVAISRLKVWAAGGGDVTPKTRVKAQKAVAEWEALKAKNKARQTTKTSHAVLTPKQWAAMQGGARPALALATPLDNSGSGPTTTQLDAGSRRRHAARGVSLADGSFPIRNATDLANAIQALGRTAPAKRGRVKAHIRRRARALGLLLKLPESWRNTTSNHPAPMKAAQEAPMSHPCPTCGVGITHGADGGLALAMPPALAKAQRAGKTGAKKAPEGGSSATTSPDAATSSVQVPKGQEEAFRKLADRIAKRPGMDREKAEKVAAALLRNRGGKS